jgi:putative hemolysin
LSFEIALSIGSIAPSGLHTKIAHEIRKAQVVKTVTSKVISKLVEKLNLGKFVKKIGDYEVYEKGEVFYRTMTKTDLETLKSTGKLTASSETFTSPTLSYIKNVGYNGTIVKFQMKTGTIEKLVKIGVRNDSGEKMMLNFSKMNRVKKGWTTNNALFKTEGGNYNIGLGKGKALETFNENIINFEIIK